MTLAQRVLVFNQGHVDRAAAGRSDVVKRRRP